MIADLKSRTNRLGNMGGRIILGAALGLVALSGCNNPSPSKSSSAGSLALSQDDAYLYAADTDNGQLAVIDTKSNQKVTDNIKVGTAPFRVTVGQDDTIYVANRGSLDVSVVRRGDWREASRITLGAEPVGMAMDPDGKTLFVVTSTSATQAEIGSLVAIDTATSQVRGTVDVGNEPRGVTVVGDHALVTLYKRGELVEVDTKSLAVSFSGGSLKNGPVYSAANATALTGSAAVGSTFRFHGLSDIVATPDGKRVFVPTELAREDAIASAPSPGGYYANGGPCNLGAVATAGVLTLDVNGQAGSSGSVLTPQVDDLTSCFSTGINSGNKDFPTTGLAPSTSAYGTTSTADPIQGPTVAAIDPTGSWLFVVNRESQVVAVVPTNRRTGEDLKFDTTGTSVRSTAKIGTGADGIALSKDGLTAYVYNQFDHRVDVIKSDGKGSSATLTNTYQPIQVAGDTLSPDNVTGRKLFYDALDTRLSAAGTNVSCATCHLEGTDDQHIWGFPDGRRATPSLAGRHLLETAPYHWSGEFAKIEDFMNHTIKERMGGSGLGSTNLSNAIASYVESLPAPFNPYQTTLAAAQVESGKAIFNGLGGCNTCHTTGNFTDNSNRNVGTVVLTGTEEDNGFALTSVDGQPGFNVPSLLGVARTGPYLHTGAESTLEDRVNDNNGAHGSVQLLNTQQKSDLVAYLKTL